MRRIGLKLLLTNVDAYLREADRFHGGIGDDIGEVARQLSALNEPRALLENKLLRPLPGGRFEGKCRGARREEVAFVLETAGCGFCLDIGHVLCAVNSLGEEPYSYVERLAGLWRRCAPSL